MCGWEWSRLTGMRSILARAGYLLLIAAIMAWLFFGATLQQQDLLVIASAGIWCGITVGLFLWRQRPLQQVRWQPVPAAFGLLLLPAAWLALLLLHLGSPNGPAITLGLMVLIWSADSAAYFTGKAFGRHKLAPVLSPGKTLEGVAGGVVAAALVGILLFLYLGHSSVTALALAAGIALVTGLVSVGGDLFESMVKRRAGEKDSGRLLPGHGGVWDRVDSLVSSSPVFVAALSLAGFAA
jgi:phosphatidate cytidylyltransferase